MLSGVDGQKPVKSRTEIAEVVLMSSIRGSVAHELPTTARRNCQLWTEQRQRHSIKWKIKRKQRNKKREQEKEEQEEEKEEQQHEQKKKRGRMEERKKHISWLMIWWMTVANVASFNSGGRGQEERERERRDRPRCIMIFCRFIFHCFARCTRPLSNQQQEKKRKERNKETETETETRTRNGQQQYAIHAYEHREINEGGKGVFIFILFFAERTHKKTADRPKLQPKKKEDKWNNKNTKNNNNNNNSSKNERERKKWNEMKWKKIWN